MSVFLAIVRTVFYSITISVITTYFLFALYYGIVTLAGYPEKVQESIKENIVYGGWNYIICGCIAGFCFLLSWELFSFLENLTYSPFTFSFDNFLSIIGKIIYLLLSTFISFVATNTILFRDYGGNRNRLVLIVTGIMALTFLDLFFILPF